MPYSDPVATPPKIDFFEERQEGPFDFWWEGSSPIFDVAPITSTANTGRFEIHSFAATSGVVVTTTFDAQSIRVTRRHCSFVANLIFVQRFPFGGVAGRSEETAFMFRPGDVGIVDFGRQIEGLHLASQLQGVYLNKESFGLDPEAPLPILEFRAGSLMARLLNAEMDRLLQALHANERAQYTDAFTRFTSCVNLAIAGAPVNGDVRTKARQALRDLICAYIERNLSSPELSTAALLRVFGVSRATLYRMFESDNGVRNYISNRRLFRAVFDITASPMRRGQIHEISERWGFSSDANFSRSVRRAFGTSPGRLCDQSLEDLQTSPKAPKHDEVIQRLMSIGGAELVAA